MPLNIFDGSAWKPFKKISIYDGSAWIDSKASYVYDGSQWKKFGAAVPVITVAPTFTWQYNNRQSAQSVSIGAGTWENSPTSFKYEWQQAPFSSTQSHIESQWVTVGSDQNSFYVDKPQIGYVLRCKIIATNEFGDSDPLYINGNNTRSIYTNGVDSVSTEDQTQVVRPQDVYFISHELNANGVINLRWIKPNGTDQYRVYWVGPGIQDEKIVTTNSSVYETTTIDTGSADGQLTVYIRSQNTTSPYSYLFSTPLESIAFKD